MSHYTLCRKLQGTKGPVNALAFSEDGKFLLSGGDDECVRVWNMVDYQCEQVIHDVKWGQITTLSWLTPASTPELKDTSFCVGTGRGSIGLFPRSKNTVRFLWKDATIMPTFSFNDSVEAQSFDPLNYRLAIASHSGQIQMFTVDTCVSLTLIWTANIKNAIPSALIFFGGTNQNLLIHGTETGEMSCRNAQNSKILWTKTLAGGSGSAALSPDEKTLVVDNLTTRTFDFYTFPSSTPSSSFSLNSIRRFAKQCIFAEGGTIAIVGSDRGLVHMVDIATNKCLDPLRFDKETDLVQVVASTATDSTRILLAAGSSSTTSPDIYIWEKKDAMNENSSEDVAVSIKQAPTKTHSTITQSIINIIFVIVIIIISYPTWSPVLWTCIIKIKPVLARALLVLENMEHAHSSDILMVEDML